jgi:competence protein ComEA
MDEAAPWRALEDPAPATSPGPAPAEIGVRARPAIWIFIAIGAAALLVVIAFWLAATGSSGTIGVEGAGPPAAGATAEPVATPGPSFGGVATKELVVDVQGAVNRPGVVHLPAGSRIGDAITAAGGYGPRVAAERVGRELNLAALLRDGDQVVVPSRDDPAQATGGGKAGSSAAPTNAGPVDLNRATASELDALPGIGPVTANKIVAARDEKAFTSVDELRSRKIVGAATFDKIKDLVAVR